MNRVSHAINITVQYFKLVKLVNHSQLYFRIQRVSLIASISPPRLVNHPPSTTTQKTEDIGAGGT